MYVVCIHKNALQRLFKWGSIATFSFVQLRLASHGLRIETGRYGRNRLERNERLCHLCYNGDIEEYHFLFICSIYTDLRVKYLSAYARKIYRLDEFR